MNRFSSLKQNIFWPHESSASTTELNGQEINFAKGKNSNTIKASIIFKILNINFSHLLNNFKINCRSELTVFIERQKLLSESKIEVSNLIQRI